MFSSQMFKAMAGKIQPQKMLLRQSMFTRQSLLTPMRRNFSKGFSTPPVNNTGSYIMAGVGGAGLAALLMHGMSKRSGITS